MHVYFKIGDELLLCLYWMTTWYSMAAVLTELGCVTLFCKFFIWIWRNPCLVYNIFS